MQKLIGAILVFPRPKMQIDRHRQLTFGSERLSEYKQMYRYFLQNIASFDYRFLQRQYICSHTVSHTIYFWQCVSIHCPMNILLMLIILFCYGTLINKLAIDIYQSIFILQWYLFHELAINHSKFSGGQIGTGQPIGTGGYPGNLFML